jgi:transcription elongation factor Elf1
MIEETAGTCPYCGETVTVVLDLSVDEQDYIEDCEVCCQPMRVICTAVSGELQNLSLDRSDG